MKEEDDAPSRDPGQEAREIKELVEFSKLPLSSKSYFAPGSRERLDYLTKKYREIALPHSAVIQEAMAGGFAGPTLREKAISYHGAFVREIESRAASVLREINPVPEEGVLPRDVAQGRQEDHIRAPIKDMEQPRERAESRPPPAPPPIATPSTEQFPEIFQKAVAQVKEEVRFKDSQKSAQIEQRYGEPNTPPPFSRRRPPDPSSAAIPTISSREWNSSVEALRRGFLPVSKETSMGSGGNLPHGRLTNAAQINPFQRHPFTIKPVWNESIKLHGSEIAETGRKNGCWCLRVTPGFLNGHPPAIQMWNADLPAGAPVWANNYGKKGLTGTQSSVLLTDPVTPLIKATNFQDTRAKVIGADGSVHGGEVPIAMRARGAYKPDQLDALDFLSNVAANADAEAASQYLIRYINGDAPAFVQRVDKSDPFPEGNRLCYQCDVVLKVARPTVKQQFSYDDIGLLRYSGFTIELPTRDDYDAQLYHVGIWTPAQQPTYWDIIFGTYIEYPYDELVLARVFLLSPIEGLRNDGPPDGTWVPFVRHNVFWNLNYSSIQQIDTFTNDRSLEWFKGILSVLAGGVAWLFAASVVNPIEASYDMVNTAFNQTAVQGQFWTG